MLQSILSFFLSILAFSTFAQKQGNIWCFGDGQYLDFNTQPPTLLNDGQTSPINMCGELHIEGTSSIADSSGSLLFYTDGKRVWNRNHEVMPNGTGLLGGQSATQAALIVPMPGTSGRYYIFTTDDFCNELSHGLRYSEIDICRDSGLGDVVAGSKNILLLDTVAEKLAAVRHANGIDYWIVVHKYFSNKFYAYQLTSQGLLTPIISAVGAVHEVVGGGPNDMAGAIGQMKISPNGERLAIAATNGANILEIFDFNTASGSVTNSRLIPSFGSYGIAFSPNGQFLYKTQELTQYDLDAGVGDVESIVANQYEYPNLPSFIGAELGPDGKIYLMNIDRTISVLSNPNSSGSSSNLELTTYEFTSDGWIYSFPAMIAGYAYSSSGICDTLTSITETTTAQPTLQVFPNPSSQSIRVEETGNSRQPTAISITDMLGHAVLRHQMQNEEENIDIGRLANGLYLLTAILENGEELRHRLVVRH